MDASRAAAPAVDLAAVPPCRRAGSLRLGRLLALHAGLMLVVSGWLIVSLVQTGSTSQVAVAITLGVVAKIALVVVALRLRRSAQTVGDDVEQRLRSVAQAELTEKQRSVQERLAETERIRADLIGTVSHEFRTPLTGIRGAALTLARRGHRLDEAGRQLLLQSIVDGQERLSRLLENMLTASRTVGVDVAAVAEVDVVAAEVATLARTARPDSAVSVVVEPGTRARIDSQALHQVLANLIDNARLHGTPSGSPLVAGGVDDRGVWVAVSNEGVTLDLDQAERLFEPFSQLASGPTREHEGMGMGLYVVRRLVEVHGGSLEMRSENGWVTVEVRLQSVRVEPGYTPTPTALPIA